jgi:hypothetical protein
MTEHNLNSLEHRKNNLLVQAALLRDSGDLDQSSELFAEAAEIEETLARDADSRQDIPTATRLLYSAASAWAHAGDFHHSVTLLRELQSRPGLPDALNERIRAFAARVHQQREQWRDSVRELASS